MLAFAVALAPAGAGAETDTDESAGTEEDGLFGLSFQQSDHPRNGGVRGEPPGTWNGKLDRPSTDWDGRQPQTEVSADYFAAPKHAGRTPPEPRRSKAVRNEVVRRIQEDLEKLGYDPGPVDGIYGAQTKTAIRAYQGDRDMTETGGVSPSLVERLAEEVAALEDEVRSPETPLAPALRAAAVMRDRPLTLEARVVRPGGPAGTLADSLVEDAVFGETAPSLREPTPSSQKPAKEADGPAEDPNVMPPTMAMSTETRSLHLATLDLAAVRELGTELPQPLLEKLLTARWHYEAAADNPLHGRFFAPGDGAPEAGGQARSLADFIAWAETHGPALPLTIAAPEALHARRTGAASSWRPEAATCFDPEPHLMARAHIDTAADFCRAALEEAAPMGVGAIEPEEATRLQACSALIELSKLRLYHQLTGDDSCGGAGYAQPRFMLDRAYVFRLAAETAARAEEAGDASDTAAGVRRFVISGVRYASQAPSMYFEMRELFADSGFARIVGGVPDSMNPARHYLIFDAEPLSPEVAAADKSPQQAAAAQE